MRVFRKKNRGQFVYLFCFLIILYACQEKKASKIAHEVTKNNTNITTDSLTISISFNEKGFTDLNLMDAYLHFVELEFNNKKQEDTIITHKIKKKHNNQVISFLGFSIINGVPKKHRHHYLIRKETTNLSFRYYKGNILLEDSREGILLDSLFDTYSKISFSIKNSKKDDKKWLRKTLDSLKNDFKRIYAIKKDTVLQTLNDYLYFEELQQLYPYDKKIDSFVQKISKPIASRALSNLLFYYVTNRIEHFNYKNLTTKKYSKGYLNVLAIGIFNFLRHENNVGNPKYDAAISWLKTTDLYNKEADLVRKQINPLDNTKFKQMFGELEMFTKDFKKVILSKVINSNEANYFLIDFWATWCKPCIEGIKLMNTKSLPENIKVISLSIDKNEKREKWKQTTTNLDQKITYLIDENNPKNTDFLELIGLTSIPRYILIDKNMNLIDEYFLHPNEFDFFEKLNDIENAKF
ncbi:redoxin domain-containing protein [Kordia sp. TARA_039_SRF]|nr:redoxin domain-containing protein [Kordia sp. TARA_039_SRF]